MLVLNVFLATLATLASAHSTDDMNHNNLDHGGDHNTAESAIVADGEATSLIIADGEPTTTAPPASMTMPPPPAVEDTSMESPPDMEDMTTVTYTSTTMAAGGEHDHGAGAMPSMDHGSSNSTHMPTQTSLPVPTSAASATHISSGLVAFLAALGLAAQY